MNHAKMNHRLGENRAIMSISSLLKFVALFHEDEKLRKLLEQDGSDPVEIAKEYGYTISDDELWVYLCSDARIAAGDMGWKY